MGTCGQLLGKSCPFRLPMGKELPIFGPRSLSPIVPIFGQNCPTCAHSAHRWECLKGGEVRETELAHVGPQCFSRSQEELNMLNVCSCVDHSTLPNIHCGPLWSFFAFDVSNQLEVTWACSLHVSCGVPKQAIQTRAYTTRHPGTHAEFHSYTCQCYKKDS